MKAQPPNATAATQAAPATTYLRQDDAAWHWLEERDEPAVRGFLDAANTQTDQWFRPLEPLVERLYAGHLARRELAVTGLPSRLDHYTLWSETAADADYPVWWRHPNDAPDQRETFFDLEARAREQSFLELGDMALSPNEEWLAWTEDTQGDETYRLFIKRLPNGQAIPLLDDIGPELCWAEDRCTLLFTRYDATQRPDSAWRLRLALNTADATASVEQEQLVLREDDPEFWIGLGKTRSRAWLTIEAASKDTSETHVVPAHTPHVAPRCYQVRETGVEYAIDHRPGYFYILHNQGAKHFQLEVEEEHRSGSRQVVIGHRENSTLEGIDAYAWGLVVAERDHREAQVRLRRLEFDGDHRLTLDAALPCSPGPLSLNLGDSPHFDDRVLRLREESFCSPSSWWSLDLDSGQRQLLKRQPLHGDLMPEDLSCRRLWAVSHDGEQVPVSVVCRKDLADQALPTLLYGYGAYGEALDPWFSVARLELLARGVAFAVAHVRGGGERGEPWYLAGKLEHKPNSFEDFLAARDALVDAGQSAPDRIVAYGASAGGLLVGASLNQSPQAFCAAVLDVPFVDVLRTMENPDLPLTTAEYTEWGNPNHAADARRIGSYSPLDNLQEDAWPPVFLQGSWHDSRVPYWEPAKLYARLSLANIASPALSNRVTLLKTDMDSGHGGASGRFKAWRDGAQQDAFILWALGLADEGDSPAPTTDTPAR
ncbi:MULTISPECIES: S9 family peptidase [unclassified Halomonas]|uniref:S9 family peptidase n=1 Tax=unclassified Halomonas TaxID=2609666 RepID=UPI001C952611|nr:MULTISPECIES: prolyl oligopeptidase family serine peptidase [unclassified Halomonas]MBY5925680.1 prolyl oligopeptidase family serine peptidase [Halomonas sp. DP4Y7-2]MBY6232501.1 prolyl oligopeptidase family serine peptidase [Halomonas sp. DP4Y7-1]